MAIPEIIEELAHKVRTEIYGRDVREAIATSMEATAEVAEWSREVAQQIIDGSFDEGALNTEIERKLNELEQEYAPRLTDVETEIDNARGNEATLGDRLDDFSSELSQTNDRISHIVNVSQFGVESTNTTNDQSEGIQQAIDYVHSLGGGTVQFNNAVYYAQGILPRDNVTLRGTGRSKLTLSPDATNHLIYYNDSQMLENFNLIGLVLDGNNLTYDLIHITEPNPGAPKKTWYMSVVDRCQIINGGVGINCPVPGSVKVINSYIAFNDIGIKQEQEHFYVTNTVIWGNRIGADIDRANHFTWVNAVFAHNTEAGIRVTNIALPTGIDSAFENAYIGCVFIDNGEYSMKGRYDRSRIVGCRFLTSQNGIETVLEGSVITGCYFDNIPGTAVVLSGESEKLGNAVVTSNVFRRCGTPVNTTKYFKGVINSNNFMDNHFGIIIRCSDINVVGNSFKNAKQESIIVDPIDGDCGYGININGNHFFNGGRTTTRNDVAHIKVDNYLIASSISSNTFRENSDRKAVHAILCLPGTNYKDVLVSANVSRNMVNDDYVLPISITKANNIGTVIDS